jgi:hypothetical protein
MLVKNEGQDVMEKRSDVIAPHGCCSGYEPIFDKINDTTSKEQQREKVTIKDVT